MNKIILFMGALLSKSAFADDDPLFIAAEKELERTYTELKNQEKPAYWIALGISDIRDHNIQAANGAIASNRKSHRRYADVE